MAGNITFVLCVSLKVSPCRRMEAFPCWNNLRCHGETSDREYKQEQGEEERLLPAGASARTENVRSLKTGGGRFYLKRTKVKSCFQANKKLKAAACSPFFVCRSYSNHCFKRSATLFPRRKCNKVLPHNIQMFKAKRFNLLRGIFFFNLHYRIIIFAALKMFCKSVNILMAGRIRSTSSMSESLIRFFFFSPQIKKSIRLLLLLWLH